MKISPEDWHMLGGTKRPDSSASVQKRKFKDSPCYIPWQDPKDSYIPCLEEEIVTEMQEYFKNALWIVPSGPRILCIELTKNGPLGRSIDWDTENRPMDTVGEGEGRMNWESRTCKEISCVKEIASGKQLYNTGSCLVLPYKREGIYVYLYISIWSTIYTYSWFTLLYNRN